MVPLFRTRERRTYPAGLPQLSPRFDGADFISVLRFLEREQAAGSITDEQAGELRTIVVDAYLRQKLATSIERLGERSDRQAELIEKKILELV